MPSHPQWLRDCIQETAYIETKCDGDAARYDLEKQQRERRAIVLCNRYLSPQYVQNRIDQHMMTYPNWFKVDDATKAFRRHMCAVPKPMSTTVPILYSLPAGQIKSLLSKLFNVYNSRLGRVSVTTRAVGNRTYTTPRRCVLYHPSTSWQPVAECLDHQARRLTGRNIRNVCGFWDTSDHDYGILITDNRLGHVRYLHGNWNNIRHHQLVVETFRGAKKTFRECFKTYVNSIREVSFVTSLGVEVCVFLRLGPETAINVTQMDHANVLFDDLIRRDSLLPLFDDNGDGDGRTAAAAAATTYYEVIDSPASPAEEQGTCPIVLDA